MHLTKKAQKKGVKLILFLNVLTVDTLCDKLQKKCHTEMTMNSAIKLRNFMEFNSSLAISFAIFICNLRLLVLLAGFIFLQIILE